MVIIIVPHMLIKLKERLNMLSTDIKDIFFKALNQTSREENYSV